MPPSSRKRRPGGPSWRIVGGRAAGDALPCPRRPIRWWGERLPPLGGGGAVFVCPVLGAAGGSAWWSGVLDRRRRQVRAGLGGGCVSARSAVRRGSDGVDDASLRQRAGAVPGLGDRVGTRS